MSGIKQNECASAISNDATPEKDVVYSHQPTISAEGSPRTVTINTPTVYMVSNIPYENRACGQEPGISYVVVSGQPRPTDMVSGTVAVIAPFGNCPVCRVSLGKTALKAITYNHKYENLFESINAYVTPYLYYAF